MFYFKDYFDFDRIRRFSVTIIDPIATGLLMSGLVIFSRSFQEFDRNRFRTFLFIVATILSISKGAMFAALVGYLFITRKHRWKLMGLSLIIGITILIVGAQFELKNIGLRGPALVSTFEFLKRSTGGQGLGTSGALAIVNLGENPIYDEELSPYALESYLGTMCIQVGFVGGAIFLIFMISLIILNYKFYKSLKNRDEILSYLSLGSAGLSIGLLFVSIPSSTGFGFAGVGTSLLMIGVIIGCSINSKFAIEK